ncbi:MAG: hypothetical protein AAF367_13255 [Pseudomonadota bacterium]
MRSLANGAAGAALLTAACTQPTPSPEAARPDFYARGGMETKAEAEDAVQTALETSLSGRQTGWRAPSGDFGFVTPVETWKSTSGHWCRQFIETVSIGGETQDREAVACRVDGRWRLAKVL